MTTNPIQPRWLDSHEYPFTSHYVHVNGANLHYIDEGSGECLLFVHGTPSWSFDFRHLVLALSRTHRCVAMDHIGFGLSAKPSPYDYSTPNHSRTLEEFITKKQLTDITLVVHDFGGPIGLRYAIDNPERVKRIVIMNSWLWSAEGDPDFEKMIHLLRSPLLPLLYRYLNFSPRILLPGSFAQRKIQSSAHRHYLKPFLKRSEREGPLAFARSLLNDQRWFESLWERRVTIADKPVLFVWGMKDPVIKPVYLEKFMSGFPNHTVVSLATCGHFPQEENPDEVVEALTSFLRMKN